MRKILSQSNISNIKKLLTGTCTYTHAHPNTPNVHRYTVYDKEVRRINDSESLRIASPLTCEVACSFLVSMRMVEMRYNIEKRREGSQKVVSCILVVKWDLQLL